MSELHMAASPDVSPETADYWHAANDGHLLLRRCKGTGQAFHYPRTVSPFTGQPDTDWIEASGRGTVYSYSVSTRQGAPHCIAYITLEEGPTVLSNLVNCDFAQVRIGQPVQVLFASTPNGQRVPVFTTTVDPAPAPPTDFLQQGASHE